MGLTHQTFDLHKRLAIEVAKLLRSIANERILEKRSDQLPSYILSRRAFAIRQRWPTAPEEPTTVSFVHEAKASKDVEIKVLGKIRELANFAITELNYFIQDNGGESYYVQERVQVRKGGDDNKKRSHEGV